MVCYLVPHGGLGYESGGVSSSGTAAAAGGGGVGGGGLIVAGGVAGGYFVLVNVVQRDHVLQAIRSM